MAASGRIADSASNNPFPVGKIDKRQTTGLCRYCPVVFQAVRLQHAHHSVDGQTHESSSARRFHVTSTKIAVAVCVGKVTSSSSSRLKDGLKQ